MKRILWKRAGRAALKAKFDEATARLAASVRSIINDPAVEDKNTMLGKSFVQYLDHLNSLTGTRTSLNDAVKLQQIFADPRNKNLDVSVGRAAPDEGMPNRRRRRSDDDDEAARLASEMDSDADRDTRGDDDDENEQKEKSMTRSLELSAIAKKYGVIAIAKSVNDKGAFLSETELTQLIVEHAKRIGSSFEKVYCTGEDAVELRKAITRCRDEAWSKAGQGQLMPLMPTQTNTLQEANDVNAGSDGKAYKQLVAMAEKMRAASPEMTLAQAFERTYTSPAARELAEQERRDSRSRLPTTGGRTAGGWGS